MMRYKQFEIKNFKGIKEITFPLDKTEEGKIFTLVGLNESGKTTILEAISLLNEDIEDSDKHKLIPKSESSSFSDEISIKATLELEDSDKKKFEKLVNEQDLVLVKGIEKITVTKIFTYKLAKHENTELEIESDVIIAKKRRGTKEYALTEDVKRKILEDLFKTNAPRVVFYQNFLSDFPNKIYLSPSLNEGKMQPSYRKVLKDILRASGESASIKELITDRIMEIDRDVNGDEIDSLKTSLDATMGRMSQKITEEVFSYWEKILTKEGDNSSPTRPKKEIVITYGIEQNRYIQKAPQQLISPVPYLEIKVKEGAEKYNISERSLGFRWFFSFFLFILFRKERVEDTGETLFLIDEPASNLHSTAQVQILETFKKITDSNKIIYTTHSHHLINPYWLETSFIVRNKALDYENEFDFGTSMTDIELVPYPVFVVNNSNQATYFQPILDSLDYQPSKLENCPEIIVVEGKNDYYTLKYINEVIFNSKYTLNFYPGTGAGKNSHVIKLYLAWGKKCIVLEDGDSAGIDGKQKYIDEIGVAIEDNVFTLADISQTWLNGTTESVFSSEPEKMKIINLYYPDQKVFSKKMFNISIQNLLMSSKKIDLNKKTITNFEKIFNFLGEKFKDEE